jgi:hypothetical protein
MAGACVSQPDGNRYWSAAGSSGMDMSSGVTWWSVYYRGVNPVIASRRLITGAGINDTWSLEATSLNRIKLIVLNTAGTTFQSPTTTTLNPMEWNHGFFWVDWGAGTHGARANNGTSYTGVVSGSPRLSSTTALCLGNRPWTGGTANAASVMHLMMGHNPVTSLTDICSALYTTGPSAKVANWGVVRHWSLGDSLADNEGSGDTFTPVNKPLTEFLTESPDSSLYSTLLYKDLSGGGGAAVHPLGGA